MCKTMYTIYDEEKDKRLYVTKTRDLNHCYEAVKDMGVAYMETCPKCQQVPKDPLYHLYTDI